MIFRNCLSGVVFLALTIFLLSSNCPHFPPFFYYTICCHCQVQELGQKELKKGKTFSTTTYQDNKC